MTLPLCTTRLFRFVLLLNLLCLSLFTNTLAYAENSPAATKVYKVVNKDGSISFSDQPQSNAETLMVEPVATVPAFSPLPSNSSNSVNLPNTQINSNRYSNFQIIAPAHDSAFYSGSGEVEVILDAQPKLHDGDIVEIWLDGAKIYSGKTLQTRIDTAARGTHSLSAKVLGASGQLFKESTIQFTVHRPSIKH